jgi:hypothetical protein
MGPALCVASKKIKRLNSALFAKFRRHGLLFHILDSPIFWAWERIRCCHILSMRWMITDFYVYDESSYKNNIYLIV